MDPTTKKKLIHLLENHLKVLEAARATLDPLVQKLRIRVAQNEFHSLQKTKETTTH